MVSQASPLAGSYTTLKRNKSSSWRCEKPNEQPQVDVLYMPHNVFEGKTYKYILTGIGVASSDKFVRPLKTKKSTELAFVLESVYMGLSLRVK